jgi:hypothetical protein
MLSIWKNQPEDYRVHLEENPDNWQFGKLTIDFSQEADAEMQEFERWLEPQLGPSGSLEHITDWAAKLAGAVARIAAMFHGCDHVPIADAQGNVPDAEQRKAASTRVSAKNVKNAIRLAKEYLLPHALAAFEMMAESQYAGKARRVLEWLGKPSNNFVDCVDGSHRVSQRSIHVYLGSRHLSDEIGEVVRILVSHGYLRRMPEEPKKGAGRPPSPVFEIHPSVFESQGKCLQNLQNSDDPIEADNFVDSVDTSEETEISSAAPCEVQSAETCLQNLHNSEPETLEDRQSISSPVNATPKRRTF